MNLHDPTGLLVPTSTGETVQVMHIHSRLVSSQASAGLGALRVLRQVQLGLAALIGMTGVVAAVAELSGDDDEGIDGKRDGRPEPQPDLIGPRDPDDPPRRGPDTCQIPPGGEPETFYHYTRWDTVGFVNRDGVRAVLGAGKIWLTSTHYSTAASAQANLALPDPPPDGYYEIPRERLEDIYGPYCVDPKFGQFGGGIEYWTTKPINMQGLTFRPFE